jgi:ribonuclease E
VLDEPTNDTTNDTSDDTGNAAAEPAKPVRRRRATKAAAPAADVLSDTAQAAADGSPSTSSPSTSSATSTGADADPAAAAAAGADVTTAAAAEGATGDAPAAPAKRTRKAPAKKAAAPRKRTAKAAASSDDAPADPVQAPEQPAEAIPLTEEELAAQAALEAGEPVITAVEDDPAAQESIADDAATVAAPEAPAKRTRTRRAATVTFQAPEPAAAPVAGAADDAEQAPAPRRRRRAGTAGAGAPGALELLEPVPFAEPVGGSTGAPEVAADADEDDEEDGDRPRRRRRGRRGRGPRRDDEGGESSAESDDEPQPAAAEGEQAESSDDDEESGTGTRRRRRRSRSRSGGNGGSEDATDEPTPAREPRAPRSRGGGGGGGERGATSADDDGVRGISGSTRMAAKRVRRQEGRDSGRKRAPLLSEAEFLARREAVDRTMIVRQKGDRTQIAVLEDGVLVEHYVTRASAQSYAGNVYLGRVQNVLPSMEAAFVDIGKSRNAVLYAGEVNYNASVGGRSRSIESVLKSGQEVLVQVSKDPIGQKGSRLTGQVSLPGRYLVYVPEGSMTGISRKLPENERSRLKSILKKVVPDDAGVIIRTAAEGASEEEIAGDVRRLQAQWEVIQAKAAKGGAPALLHAEPDLVIRVVRDVFNEDFTSLVVQGDSEWDTIKEYVEFVAPDLAPRLSRHTSDKDVFAEHRVDEQLLKALDRKVYLPSGGSLVIDRTEAMVVVDVNTGKFVGKGGNLEETVTRNNLEAAEEIARQLRLRDLGGIIVVDFIDMVLESNRDLVVRRLVECLGRDRTKHQVAEVTSLGLVQMTRKRVGQGLLESFSEPCEACNGRGVHVRPEPVDERKGGGGGEDSRRAPKVRSAKPLPADAPKPGAAIAAAARVAAAASDGTDDGAAGSGDAAAADGSEAGDGAAPPKRRRRGGRGSGAATVPAEQELAEILTPVDVQPGTDQVLPDTTVDGDLEVSAGAKAAPSGAASPAEVALVEPAPVQVPDATDALVAPVEEPVEAAPKRRRRATSRPAGPPA